MVRCNFSLASEDDDGSLKECSRLNGMSGTISITFETEPSFFDALDVQGKENQVVAGKTDDGKLMGFGVRTIKPLHVNGQVTDVGYLSSLKGHPQYRRNMFLAKGFRFFKELDQDGRVPFYITTIIGDNVIARKTLEGGRAGLPNYYPIGVLSTFVIKPQSQKTSNRFEIVRGKSLSLDEIVGFMNKEGSNKQFYPHYEKPDFDSPFLRDLDQNDFYVALERDEIVGVVAKWDQGSFKQTRVAGYDKKMKFARPFINLASKFSNIPYLPKEGKLLRYFNASFPTTKDNDPVILKKLLSSVASDSENKKYDYFTIGLSDSDPLVEAVKPFSPREYRAVIYAVSYDKSKEDLKFLNGRIPYLELGTL